MSTMRPPQRTAAPGVSFAADSSGWTAENSPCSGAGTVAQAHSTVASAKTGRKWRDIVRLRSVFSGLDAEPAQVACEFALLLVRERNASVSPSSITAADRQQLFSLLRNQFSGALAEAQRWLFVALVDSGAAQARGEGSPGRQQRRAAVAVLVQKEPQRRQQRQPGTDREGDH